MEMPVTWTAAPPPRTQRSITWQQNVARHHPFVKTKIGRRANGRAIRDPQWDNYRAFFALEAEHGIYNPVLNSRRDDFVTNWEDFLLLCCRNTKKSIAEDFNAYAPRLARMVDVQDVKQLQEKCLVNVAREKDFHVDIIRHEFEWAMWYSETTYFNNWWEAKERGDPVPPPYSGPESHQSQHRPIPRKPDHRQDHQLLISVIIPASQLPAVIIPASQPPAFPGQHDILNPET